MSAMPQRIELNSVLWHFVFELKIILDRLQFKYNKKWGIKRNHNDIQKAHEMTDFDDDNGLKKS